MKALSHLKYAMPFLALALVAPLPASAASAVRVYITNSAGDSIHVIDPGDQQGRAGDQELPRRPRPRLSPDGTGSMSPTRKPSTLDVLDRKTGKLIKKVVLSGHPNIVAVKKAGDHIVVAIARGKGGLDIIDGTTLTLKKTIPTAGACMTSTSRRTRNSWSAARSRPRPSMPSISTRKSSPGAQDGSRRALHGHRDQSGRIDQAGLHPDFGPQRLLRGRLRRAQGSDQGAAAGAAAAYDHGGYRTDEPSHGISMSPDNKTLWVTSIPNNAVYVYDVASSRTSARWTSPARRSPGTTSRCPRCRNGSPSRRTASTSTSPIVLRSVSVVDTGGDEGRQGHPGRRSAEAQQYAGDPGRGARRRRFQEARGPVTIPRRLVFRKRAPPRLIELEIATLAILTDTSVVFCVGGGAGHPLSRSRRDMRILWPQAGRIPACGYGSIRWPELRRKALFLRVGELRALGPGVDRLPIRIVAVGELAAARVIDVAARFRGERVDQDLLCRGSSTAWMILDTVSKFLRVCSSVQLVWPPGSSSRWSMLLAPPWHITQRAWVGRLVRKIGCTLALKYS